MGAIRKRQKKRGGGEGPYLFRLKCVCVRERERNTSCVIKRRGHSGKRKKKQENVKQSYPTSY